MLFFRPAVKRDGNGPSPGLEAAIRPDLDGDFAGNPALEIMSPLLQRATQQQWKAINADREKSGRRTGHHLPEGQRNGLGRLSRPFANGTETVQAAPLTDGKLTAFSTPHFRCHTQPQHPGTEAWLRRHIAAVLKGTPIMKTWDRF